MWLTAKSQTLFSAKIFGPSSWTILLVLSDASSIWILHGITGSIYSSEPLSILSLDNLLIWVLNVSLFSWFSSEIFSVLSIHSSLIWISHGSSGYCVDFMASSRSLGVTSPSTASMAWMWMEPLPWNYLLAIKSVIFIIGNTYSTNKWIFFLKKQFTVSEFSWTFFIRNKIYIFYQYIEIHLVLVVYLIMI